MRHLIAVASVVAAFTLLISAPVLARTTTHGGGHVVGHTHRVMAGDRFVFISRTGFDNHFLVFDRFSRRFIAMPRHRFDRFDRTDGFSGWGWGWDWGAGGWADYGAGFASAEPPAAGVGALQPPAPPSPASLPRCHEETSVGVVIERGAGCAH